MPAPMARWSRRRLSPAPAGSSRPGLRRAAPPRSSAREMSARQGPGGSACSPAAPGLAPGSPTPEQRTAFERAARSGVVVVQSSRASGRVAPRRRLRESGIVAGEDLSPQKARILLMLALLTTSDVGEVQRAFQTY